MVINGPMSRRLRALYLYRAAAEIIPVGIRPLALGSHRKALEKHNCPITSVFRGESLRTRSAYTRRGG